MKNIIRIKDAAFYAYHGVLPQEKISGGKFEVDASIYSDFISAAVNDNVEETVNYADVYELIKEYVTTNKYDLIETLTYNIARGIIEKFINVDRINVRVRKYNLPIEGNIKYAETEIEMDRDEF